MQPRPSEVKKALPPLTFQQEEMLKKAKRYAMEQSVQQVSDLESLVKNILFSPVIKFLSSRYIIVIAYASVR